ncbi:hypothetical protein SAMN04488589_0272 [Methanolobus vulcani]|uniref:CD-NTase-associated protein 15 domain-containing protein n=2 Tax=Methanolobus vulcani TaxID=38026 RepID=A0A7Z7FDA6_9EURY|nr:hypothetical protein SAMN04488589_0272 [Methanolobus vulcani]
MHSYSIDEKRIKILSSIGSLAFIASLIILKIFNPIVDNINALPYINHVPYIPQLATFGFLYMLFFYLLDRVLWKISLKGFRLSKVPDLNGKWKGHIITSHNSRYKIDITVDIQQTWSSISIILKTNTSKSKSEVASISLSESRLVYQYVNEPSSNSAETMHKHYGITFLDFEEINTLKGSYFTCRDRQTHGDIFLKRSKS